MPGERLEELSIPMMFPDNQEKHKTAYAVTVDAAVGQSRLPVLFLGSLGCCVRLASTGLRADLLTRVLPPQA